MGQKDDSMCRKEKNVQTKSEGGLWWLRLQSSNSTVVVAAAAVVMLWLR